MRASRLLLVLIGVLSAPCWSATWKDSPYVTINKMYPFDAGLIIYTSHADPTVSSCDNGTRFAIHYSDENYSVKASLLMAAFMSGKKVLLRYDSSQDKACEARVNRFIVNK